MTSMKSLIRWSLPVLALVAACGHGPGPGVPVAANWPVGALPGYDYSLTAVVLDGGGTAVACRFDWGDSTMSDWTEPVPSGSVTSACHCWQAAGSYAVRMQARNVRGLLSGWSEPAYLRVGDVHPVLWSINLGEDVWSTSPMVIPGAGSDVVYLGTGWFVVGCDTRGVRRFTAPPVPIDSEDNYFNTTPAYCAATGHVVMAHEEGELYAFTSALALAWHWPGNANPNRSDYYVPWSSFAVDGNFVYACRGNDDFYATLNCVADFGDHGVAVGRCSLATYDDVLLCPPAIGPDGNVIVATDYDVSVYSPRFDQLLWVENVGYDIWGLAIAADGAIFCATDDGTMVYEPNGDERWQARDDYAAGLALDDSLVYAARFDGSVCARSLDDGRLVWEAEPDTWGSSCGAPLLAANGVLYVLDDANEALHCYRRADGAKLWTTELPGANIGASFDEVGPELNITSAGDIIVVGETTLFCVQGYPDGQLADVPWPKWQHDVGNTGCSRSTRFYARR
jgi:outer membrane protein assembly factor BamB